MSLRCRLLILVIPFFINVNSQEPWSLEKCIQYALDNNIQIRQQALTVESSESSLKQSRLGMLPNLNASGNQQLYFGRTINPYSFETNEDNRRTNSFSVNSSVTLFQGLQKYNTMRAYEYNLKANVMNVEKEKNNVSLNVAAAYMQILYNEELVKVSQTQVDLTKQQEDRMIRLVDAGKKPAGDLLDIQSQKAQDELTLVNAQNQLQQSCLTLTQLLELKSYDGFTIVKPEESALNTQLFLDSMNIIVQEAMNFLPDVKAAEFQMEAYRKSLQAAKGYLSPSLNFNSGYGTYYSNRLAYNIISGGVVTGQYYPSFSDQLSDNRNFSMVFSLNIPIFNGYQTRNNINQNRVNLYKAQNSFELTKKQIYKDIQQVYLSAVSAQKRFLASEEAVKANREAFRYATQKLDNGIMTTVEYSTVKTKLAKSESDLLQAKYEYVYRTKQLDFYRGKGIKF